MKLIFPKTGRIINPTRQSDITMLLNAGYKEYREPEKTIDVFSPKNLKMTVREKDVQPLVDEGWRLEPIPEEKKELEPKRGRRE